jgi:hypothetical protein
MSIIRYNDVLSRPIGIGTDLDVSILEWITQQIDIANDGIIRVRITDLKKVLGPDCEKKSNSVLFVGLRYALKRHGIDVRIRTYKDGNKVLIMHLIS